MKCLATKLPQWGFQNHNWNNWLTVVTESTWVFSTFQTAPSQLIFSFDHRLPKKWIIEYDVWCAGIIKEKYTFLYISSTKRRWNSRTSWLFNHRARVTFDTWYMFDSDFYNTIRQVFPIRSISIFHKVCMSSIFIIYCFVVVMLSDCIFQCFFSLLSLLSDRIILDLFFFVSAHWIRS